jgi:hypothetical protein
MKANMSNNDKKRAGSRLRGRVRTARERLPVPGLRLGRVISPVEGGCRVMASGEERLARLDPSVDPALLPSATASGARAVLEVSESGEWLLVGFLATRRAVELSPAGDVDVEVRRWRVHADHEVLFKSPGAFLQLKVHEVELYANRIACRARELTRLLGRMIKLN